jgi:hypothetical protein
VPAPIPSWFNTTNDTPVTQWPVGTVDAGSVSPDTTFLVWNNRGGASVVSDMTACTITTKDNLGGDTGEIITNKWIEVRVDSMSEASFTAIGGTTSRPVKAAAQAAGVVKGSVNDGTIANASANFAQVTLHANVPALATAGNITFLTRVSYQYI